MPLTVVVASWAVGYFSCAPMGKQNQPKSADIKKPIQLQARNALADQMIYLMERHVPRQT